MARVKDTDPREAQARAYEHAAELVADITGPPEDPGPEHIRTDRLRLVAAQLQTLAGAARTRELTQADRDRTALARGLHRMGMPRHELADVLGVDWTRVDRVLAGGRP